MSERKVLTNKLKFVGQLDVMFLLFAFQRWFIISILPQGTKLFFPNYRIASGFLTKSKNEQREILIWQTIINARIPHAVVRSVTTSNIAAIIVRTPQHRTL